MTPKTRKALEMAFADYCGRADYDAELIRKAITEALAGPAPPIIGDLDLAKATVRAAGYSLVTQRFIITFAEFIQDWRKGDFDLPALAACDVRSCFDTWQETANQVEVTKPAPRRLTKEDIAKAAKKADCGWLFETYSHSMPAFARAIEARIFGDVK